MVHREKMLMEILHVLYTLEEINPRTGGHDIPYQRERIIDVATDF